MKLLTLRRTAAVAVCAITCFVGLDDPAFRTARTSAAEDPAAAAAALILRAREDGVRSINLRDDQAKRSAKKNLDEAEKILRKTLSNNPNCETCLDGLVATQFYQAYFNVGGKYDECIQTAAQALAHFPGLAGAAFFKGYAEFNSGDLTAATRSLKRYLQSPARDPRSDDEVKQLLKMGEERFLTTWYGQANFYQSPESRIERYNPQTMRNEIVYQFTPEWELGIGQQSLTQVSSQAPRLQDPELEAYLTQLANRLAGATPGPSFTYRVTVLDSPVVNAVTPPGQIIVFKGLIAFADTEGQLAGVLSHELAHNYAHHVARRVIKQYQAQALAAGIMQAVNPQNQAAQLIMNISATMGLDLILKAYSRFEEKEADLYGTHILFNAGYNPTAMSEFFLKMYEQNPKQPVKFLSTHPPVPDRADYLTDYLEGYPLDRELSVDSDVFRKIKTRYPSAPRLTTELMRTDRGVLPPGPAAPSPGSTVRTAAAQTASARPVPAPAPTPVSSPPSPAPAPSPSAPTSQSSSGSTQPAGAPRTAPVPARPASPPVTAASTGPNHSTPADGANPRSIADDPRWGGTASPAPGTGTSTSSGTSAAAPTGATAAAPAVASAPTPSGATVSSAPAKAAPSSPASTLANDPRWAGAQSPTSAPPASPAPAATQPQRSSTSTPANPPGAPVTPALVPAPAAVPTNARPQNQAGAPASTVIRPEHAARPGSGTVSVTASSGGVLTQSPDAPLVVRDAAAATGCADMRAQLAQLDRETPALASRVSELQKHAADALAFERSLAPGAPAHDAAVRSRELAERELAVIRDQQTGGEAQATKLREALAACEVPALRASASASSTPVASMAAAARVLGVWGPASGDLQVAFRETSDVVSGVAYSVPDAWSPLHAKPGDTVFLDGRRTDDVIRGFYINLPQKGECPDLPRKFSAAILKFDPDGQTLEVTATEYKYWSQTCRWSDTYETKSYIWHRVGPR